MILPALNSTEWRERALKAEAELDRLRAEKAAIEAVSPQDDLPPGPYEIFKCEDERWGWEVEDKDGRLIAQNCTEQFARAIAEIPEMRAENERLLAVQTTCDVFKEENRRLRAEFTKVACLLEPHWQGAGAKLEAEWMMKIIQSLATSDDELDRLRAEKAAIESTTIERCAQWLDSNGQPGYAMEIRFLPKSANKTEGK